MKTSNSGMRKMRDSDYYASFFGACMLSLGIGVILSSFIITQIAYFLILSGILIHGWAMFRMQRMK